MKKYYGLTKTEKQIMDIFWDSDQKELTSKDMMEYSKTILKKEWKVQTLCTFLTNLQKMGLLGIRVQGRKNIYYAVCTREEHIHNWTRNLIQAEFGNSIGNFLLAFTGGKNLSQEEADEIKKLIYQE